MQIFLINLHNQIKKPIKVPYFSFILIYNMALGSTIHLNYYDVNKLIHNHFKTNKIKIIYKINGSMRERKTYRWI